MPIYPSQFFLRNIRHSLPIISKRKEAVPTLFFLPKVIPLFLNGSNGFHLHIYDHWHPQLPPEKKPHRMHIPPRKKIVIESTSTFFTYFPLFRHWPSKVARRTDARFFSRKFLRYGYFTFFLYYIMIDYITICKNGKID